MNQLSKSSNITLQLRLHAKLASSTIYCNSHLEWSASGQGNVADALSRSLEPSLLNLITPPSSPLDYLQLAVAQRTDPEITDLRRNNSTALVLKDILLAEHGINILCDVSTGRLQPVISICLRASVFKHFHLLAYPGIKGSIALLTEKVV